MLLALRLQGLPPHSPRLRFLRFPVCLCSNGLPPELVTARRECSVRDRRASDSTRDTGRAVASRKSTRASRLGRAWRRQILQQICALSHLP